MPTPPSPPPDLPEPVVVAVAWRGGADDGTLRLLDQTRLPAEETYLDRARCEDVVDDIRRLAVRGAPAIGLAGAYALVLGAREAAGVATDPAEFAARFAASARRVAEARPTAVNLSRAVLASLRALTDAGAPAGHAARVLLDAARSLEAFEREASFRIAEAGAVRLEGLPRVLTHCNTGALVTPGFGTALAPLVLRHARGEPVHVWVDETRPLLQGLRLTAWELARGGVPHTVLSDGAAADLMRREEVDAVLVGADRVCRNGDVVNKIGTYAAAVAAHHHGVPFLVAAPLSTLDPSTPSGEAVPIENRPGDLLRYLTPDAAHLSSPTWEPAFDVTPAALVSCLLTDRGPVERPDEARLRPFMEASRALQTTGARGR